MHTHFVAFVMSWLKYKKGQCNYCIYSYKCPCKFVQKNGGRKPPKTALGHQITFILPKFCLKNIIFRTPEAFIRINRYHNGPVFRQTSLSKQCRPRSDCSNRSSIRLSDQGLHCLPFRLHILVWLISLISVLRPFNTF